MTDNSSHLKTIQSICLSVKMIFLCRACYTEAVLFPVRAVWAKTILNHWSFHFRHQKEPRTNECIHSIIIHEDPWNIFSFRLNQPLQGVGVNRLHHDHLHFAPLSVFILLDRDIYHDFIKHCYNNLTRCRRDGDGVVFSIIGMQFLLESDEPLQTEPKYKISSL